MVDERGALLRAPLEALRGAEQPAAWRKIECPARHPGAFAHVSLQPLDATGARRARWFVFDARFAQGYWGETNDEREPSEWHEFARRGSAKGELARPRGACAGAGSVWVADPANRRLARFDLDGNWIEAVEQPSAGVRWRPIDVAMDPAGTLIVLDELSGCLWRGVVGEAWRPWVQPGGSSGRIDGAAAIDAWTGVIAVAERFGQRVQVFDALARPLYQFGAGTESVRPALGGLRWPSAVALTENGKFACVFDAGARRLVLVGEVDAHAENGGDGAAHAAHDGDGGSARHARAGDAAGDWAAWVEPSRGEIELHRLDAPSHEPRLRLRGPNSKAGRLEPVDVVVDARAGRLWACDPLRHTLFEFAFDERGGQVRRTLDMQQLGLDCAWPVEPCALSQAVDGTLAVADRQNGCVWLVAPSLEGIGRISPAVDGPAEVCDVAFSSDGTKLALVERWSETVFVFDRAGKETARLEGLGRPRAVRATPDGGWIVSEHGACQLIVVGKDGEERARWGRFGDGALEFGPPGDVLPGPDGHWIVLDPANGRAQMISARGEFRFCL